MENISNIAHIYDYENIPADGYRAAVKFWTRILEASLLIESSTELMNEKVSWNFASWNS